MFLSEVLGTMLVNYHAVAAVLTALSTASYANLTALVQKMDWPISLRETHPV
jgi:hypothetical protein